MLQATSGCGNSEFNSNRPIHSSRTGDSNRVFRRMLREIFDVRNFAYGYILQHFSVVEALKSQNRLNHADCDTSMKLRTPTQFDALKKMSIRPQLKLPPNAIFRLGYLDPVPLRGIYHNSTASDDIAMKFGTGT